MSPRFILLHPGLYPDLVAALATTGTEVDLAIGTAGTIRGVEITEVYVDELPPQQQPVMRYRPTHKGKVVAQWKNESRGRRS